LVLIDFPHQIPEAMKNNNLNEELKVEAPGILAWAIRGCLEWQRGGLNPPEKVLNSTRPYFEEQENVRRWLDECCELTGNPNDKDECTLCTLCDIYRRRGLCVGFHLYAAECTLRVQRVHGQVRG